MNIRLASALSLALASTAFSLELSGATSLPISEIHSDDIQIKVSGEYQVKWKFWTLYGEPVREAVAAVRFTPGSARINVKWNEWESLPDQVLAKITFKDATIGLSRPYGGHILLMDVGVHAAPCVSRTVPSTCWGFNTPGSPDWGKLSLVDWPGVTAFKFNRYGNEVIFPSDTAFPEILVWSKRNSVMDFVKEPNLQKDLQVIGAKVRVDLGAARAYLAGRRAAEKEALLRKIESNMRISDSLEAERLRKAAKKDADFWNQPSGSGASAQLTTNRHSKQSEWKEAKEEWERFRKDSARAITAWQATVETQRIRLGELKVAAARGLQVSKRHPLQCVELEKFMQQGGIPPKGIYPANSRVLVDSATGLAVGTEGYYSCNSGVNFVEVARHSGGSDPSRKPWDNWAIVDHTGRVILSADQAESVQLFENQYALTRNKNEVTLWNLQEGKKLVGPLQKTGKFWGADEFGDTRIVDLGDKGRVFKVLLDGSVSQIDTKRCGHYNVVRRFRYFDMTTGKDVGGTEEAKVESPFCLSAS